MRTLVLPRRAPLREGPRRCAPRVSRSTTPYHARRRSRRDPGPARPAAPTDTVHTGRGTARRCPRGTVRRRHRPSRAPTRRCRDRRSPACPRSGTSPASPRSAGAPSTSPHRPARTPRARAPRAGDPRGHPASPTNHPPATPRRATRLSNGSAGGGGLPRRGVVRTDAGLARRVVTAPARVEGPIPRRVCAARATRERPCRPWSVPTRRDPATAAT